MFVHIQRLGLEGGDDTLTVSIPLVVLLGVAMVLAVRYLKLRLGMALVCAVFGYLLAATTLAPEIDRALRAFLGWITSGS
ncbi:hypothetical protein ACIBQ6_50350 [Nonomuraea sp. NPDC049655]|uniref:hypothetical protein n=1 Tax=Nonomuraea sp. NPDC049655 TaxID=3364355 RepID=UPI0037B3CA2E